MKTNYATCLNAPGPAVKPNDEAAAAKARQQEKEQIAHAIAIAEMNEKLKIINDRTAVPKVKTPQEQRIESFERDFSGVMGLEDHLRRKRSELAELYKNEPELLKRANLVVDAIARKYL